MSTYLETRSDQLARPGAPRIVVDEGRESSPPTLAPGTPASGPKDAPVLTPKREDRERELNWVCEWWSP